MTMIKGEARYCTPGHDTYCRAGVTEIESEKPNLLSTNGTLWNLAFGLILAASKQLSESPAEYAVDGELDTVRISGDMPKHWIKLK